MNELINKITEWEEKERKKEEVGMRNRNGSEYWEDGGEEAKNGVRTRKKRREEDGEGERTKRKRMTR